MLEVVVIQCRRSRKVKFPSKWIAGVTLLAASALLLSPVASAQKRVAIITSDDDAFLALRDAASRDDATKAYEFAARLSNYASPSYVDYFRLKSRLRIGPRWIAPPK